MLTASTFDAKYSTAAFFDKPSCTMLTGNLTRNPSPSRPGFGRDFELTTIKGRSGAFSSVWGGTRTRHSGRNILIVLKKIFFLVCPIWLHVFPFFSSTVLNKPVLGTLIDLTCLWHHFHLYSVGWDEIQTHDLLIVNLVCYPLVYFRLFSLLFNKSYIFSQPILKK